MSNYLSHDRIQVSYKDVMIPRFAQTAYQYSKVALYGWMKDHPTKTKILFLPLSLSLAGCSLVFGVAHIIESFAYSLINLVGLTIKRSKVSAEFLKISVIDLAVGGPAFLLAAPYILLRCPYKLLADNQYSANRLAAHQQVQVDIEEKLKRLLKQLTLAKSEVEVASVEP